MTKGQLRILLDVGAIALFVFAGWLAMDFRDRARSMPYFLTAAGVLLGLVNLLVDVHAVRKGVDDTLREKLGPPTRVVRFVAWPIGYVLMIWLVSMPLATAIFLVAFLSLEAEFRWHWSLLSAGVVVALLFAFSEAFTIHWPPSLLI